jgi:spore maturation protein CgeB
MFAIPKKKFLFLLNFYDNFNLDPKKNNQFNTDQNSWEKVFSSLTCNTTKPKIFYLNFLKKKFKKKDQYINYLDSEIKKFKPDYLVSTLNDEKVHQLIFQNRKFYKKSVVMHSAYLSNKQILNYKKIYNAIITANKKIVDLSNGVKLKNFYLELSVPNSFFKKNIKFEDKNSKIFFSGSLGYRFKYRNEILNFLVNEFKNTDFRLRHIYENIYALNIFNKLLIKYFPRFSYYLYKKKFLPLSNKLKFYSKNPLFGEKLLEFIRKNKFVINCNSDFDKDTCVNLRIYETLSQGSVLFTDENKLMRKYFKNNKHLIYYKNEFDLKEKILKISNNPKLGIKISQEAIKIIKKYHTSEYRFKKFISIINKI